MSDKPVAELGVYAERALSCAGTLPELGFGEPSARDVLGDCLDCEGTPYAYALFALCYVNSLMSADAFSRCEGGALHRSSVWGTWYGCPGGALCPKPWCVPPAEDRYCAGECERDVFERANQTCDEGAQCNTCSGGTCRLRCERCGDQPRFRLECSE